MGTRKISGQKAARKTKAPASRKSASVVKASGEKTGIKKALLKAPSEHAFYCADGRLFYDLRELANGLMSINIETFYHHVHDGNNDFSNWVRDVLRDSELADYLAGTTDKDEITTYVVAQLDTYEDNTGASSIG